MQDDLPLLLVVCGDPERLARAREQLREAGFLPVSGRSVEASLALLTQVRVDGCLVLQGITDAEARGLEEALDRFSPDGPRLYVPAHQPRPLPRWRECDEASWLESVAAAFAGWQPLP